MEIPERISKYLTAKECFKSPTAIRLGVSNLPTEEHLANIITVATKVFDVVREHFGVPIGVTSVYRSEALNKAVKGAKGSAHLKGQAIDIDADVFGKLTNSEIFHYIKDNLEYDTLIWEYGDDKNPDWVHVAYVEGHNRKRNLVAYAGKDGDAEYRNF